jgi:NAD(P)-dependent dehydrogenase (short-subunit alcohol dehydrogenase family)
MVQNAVDRRGSVDRHLAGRVIVATGAATGIGRGLARAAAAAGMTVVAADVNAAAIEDTVAELQAGGTEALGGADRRA